MTDTATPGPRKITVHTANGPITMPAVSAAMWAAELDEIATMAGDANHWAELAEQIRGALAEAGLAETAGGS